MKEERLSRESAPAMGYRDLQRRAAYHYFAMRYLMFFRECLKQKARAESSLRVRGRYEIAAFNAGLGIYATRKGLRLLDKAGFDTLKIKPNFRPELRSEYILADEYSTELCREWQIEYGRRKDSTLVQEASEAELEKVRKEDLDEEVITIWRGQYQMNLEVSAGF